VGTVQAAQPIRTYESPISIVWTRGEPFSDADCRLLTAALTSGHADIIEHGHWGRYNVILRLGQPEEKSLYFLADVVDADQTGEPEMPLGWRLIRGRRRRRIRKGDQWTVM
jgi:hypothetical protein